jgi:hypothetical protein
MQMFRPAHALTLLLALALAGTPALAKSRKAADHDQAEAQVLELSKQLIALQRPKRCG